MLNIDEIEFRRAWDKTESAAKFPRISIDALPFGTEGTINFPVSRGGIGYLVHGIIYSAICGPPYKAITFYTKDEQLTDKPTAAEMDFLSFYVPKASIS